MQRLHADSRPRPLVAAHRGASREHPENTLSAFGRATELGVAIQEFDVRELSCGELVCIHDDTFDRTTDSPKALGCDAFVAQTDHTTAKQLDAGSWHAHGNASERIPTLVQALQVMLPVCVPLIEHKAGSAERFVQCLQSNGYSERIILQSFDWHFLAEVHCLAPEIALGALGPNPPFPDLTRAAIDHTMKFAAKIVHWRAKDLARADANLVHECGQLLFTYTTDDEPGWLRGKAMGFDAMCTNDPSAMIAALRSNH